MVPCAGLHPVFVRIYVSRLRLACRAVAIGAVGYGAPTLCFGAAPLAFTVFRLVLSELACRVVAPGAVRHGPPSLRFGAAVFAFTVFKRRLVEPRRLELLTFSLRMRRHTHARLCLCGSISQAPFCSANRLLNASPSFRLSRYAALIAKTRNRASP